MKVIIDGIDRQSVSLYVFGVRFLKSLLTIIGIMWVLERYSQFRWILYIRSLFSIFEGIAYGTRHVFETYAEIGSTPKKIFSVGGGTKNQIWSKTTSDITGQDQILRQTTIGASYGDAFLAAVAIGDCGREKIHEWNPVESEIKSEPNEIYEKGYRIFRKLYEQTKNIMKELDN